MGKDTTRQARLLPFHGLVCAGADEPLLDQRSCRMNDCRVNDKGRGECRED